MKYTGMLIVIGGAALVISFRLLRHTHARPNLGPVSEQWLFEKRRYPDDQ